MNLLVVGNSGNIGSNLYSEISSLFTSSENNIDGINTSILDLRSTVNIENYLNDLNYLWDVIIFLVGRAHKKGKPKDYKLYEEQNVMVLKNFMIQLKKKDLLPKKFIFASTISVYGEQMNVSYYDETYDPKPKTPYAVTKLIAEEYLLDNYSEITWILRFAPVYSSDFQLNIDSRVKIKSFYFRVGDGSHKLSLCNMKNILKVVLGIIDDKIPNGVYNISDTKQCNYKDLLEYKKSSYVFIIPKLFVKIFYYLGNLLKNNYLIENSIKLLSNNEYPNYRIKSFIDLPHKIKDV